MTREVIERIGGTKDYNLHDALGAENIYNYRNKIIEPFSKQNGKVITGFFKKKSHDIFVAKENWLQSREMNEILEYLLKVVNNEKISVYNEKEHKGILRHVMLRINSKKELMLVLVVNSKLNDKLKDILNKVSEKFQNIKSVYISINTKRTNVALGKENIHLFGNKFIKEELFDIEFNISPNSFFQINIEQVQKLYNIAISYFSNIENKYIVDAYSGTGTIGMLLSKFAKKVYAIEMVESATKDAIRTAKDNNIKNIQFINGKVEEELEKLILNKNIIDSIIFDPPRKGIESKILEEVAQQKIKEIIYISCNPSTFARDIKILKDYGYKLVEVQPVDMFPQTNHIELVGKIILLEEK
ncbi:MAG: 23S rRNA (uracil(1939)-C(5))-methyltransferase RlmD, partial [Fusobacteriaceae bacterium]|nr:23S rRNA (uracil(1939)-C(5))-methyltransferase RlmD [Fusobacteriaceae bacterium]